MVAVATRPRRPATAAADATILEQLLGSELDDLGPALRRFHASSDDVVGTGTFRVEQAGSRAGRLVARTMRMPTASGDTPVRLSIVRGRSVEHWRRHFGDEVMASTQTTDGRHLLEQIGRLELRFTVDLADQRVRFRHVATRLRIGRGYVPIPRALSPSIAASVGAVDDRVDVAVRISAPIVGTLLRYSGRLTPSDCR